MKALYLFFTAIVIFLSGATHSLAVSKKISDAFVLKNGITVVVIPNHLAPAVTHMVWYKVGGIDEINGKSGLAHLLEHLMFKGTKAVGNGEFSKMIALHGGDDNAFTTQDYTAYYQTIAKEHLGLVMKLEADRMLNLVLNKEETEKEIQIVLEERRTRVDNIPQSLIREKIQAALFPDHPYGVPVIGWRNDIIALEMDDISTFYHRFYAPNNAIVVISGDVTAKEVKALAETHYGVLPRREVKRNVVPYSPSPATTPAVVELRDARMKSPELFRYYIAPSQNYGTKEDAYATSLLAHIMGGDESSRLYKRLVNERRVANFVSVYYDDISLGPSQLSIHAVPAPGVTLELLQQTLDEEIFSLIQSGVTGEELARAKTIFTAEAIYARDGLMQIARVFGQSFAAGLDADYVEGWPDRIMMVNPGNIQNAVETVLGPGARFVTGKLLPAEPL